MRGGLRRPRRRSDKGAHCRQRSSEVGSCGACLAARGITDESLVAGARRSSLEELTELTLWAERVVAF
jgi:uncharacterized protein involved in oxidation of intracellular sulfur